MGGLWLDEDPRFFFKQKTHVFNKKQTKTGPEERWEKTMMLFYHDFVSLFVWLFLLFLFLVEINVLISSFVFIAFILSLFLFIFFFLFMNVLFVDFAFWCKDFCPATTPPLVNTRSGRSRPKHLAAHASLGARTPSNIRSPTFLACRLTSSDGLHGVDVRADFRDGDSSGTSPESLRTYQGQVQFCSNCMRSYDLFSLSSVISVHRHHIPELAFLSSTKTSGAQSRIQPQTGA